MADPTFQDVIRPSSGRSGAAFFGAAPGHFGEIVQGLLPGPGGRKEVALVTLPRPGLGSRAFWTPDDREDGVRVSGPGGGLLAQQAAERACRALGRAARGRLSVETEAEPGAGAGSSTSAIIASLRAVGAAPLGADWAQEAALALEGASDPLAFEDFGALLWAPRRAARRARFAPPPPLCAVGGYDGPPSPTDPKNRAFADVSDLIAALEPAFAAGDVALIGDIATRSARRHQERAPKPTFGAVLGLAAETRALGVAASHTGSAISLLFAPGDPAAAQALDGLHELGLGAPAVFATDEPELSP